MAETPEEITPELADLLKRASESPSVLRPRRQRRDEIDVLMEATLQMKAELKVSGNLEVSLEEDLYEDRRNDRSFEPKDF